MPIPFANCTFDVRRPFGAAADATTGVVGCLTPAELPKQFWLGPATDLPLIWTHTLDVESDVDIRDGWTRTAGNMYPTYSDGDEVRIMATGGGTSRYVVMYVEVRSKIGMQGTMYKRAYLLRHSASWPGP